MLYPTNDRDRPTDRPTWLGMLERTDADADTQQVGGRRRRGRRGGEGTRGEEGRQQPQHSARAIIIIVVVISAPDADAARWFSLRSCSSGDGGGGGGGGGSLKIKEEQEDLDLKKSKVAVEGGPKRLRESGKRGRRG